MAQPLSCRCGLSSEPQPSAYRRELKFADPMTTLREMTAPVTSKDCSAMKTEKVSSPCLLAVALALGALALALECSVAVERAQASVLR